MLLVTLSVLEGPLSNGILKEKNTIETSSYGAELVALRIAIEALIEVRYKLRMMGVPIQQVSSVLCDNAAVIVNTQLPSSSIKKKHNSVAYHKARETVAAKIIRMGKVPGNSCGRSHSSSLPSCYSAQASKKG